MLKIIPNQFLAIISHTRWYNKYASSVDYYENQAVPEADLIIEQASRSYEAGALDYIDYILTLNRALTIKQNYLMP